MRYSTFLLSLLVGLPILSVAKPSAKSAASQFQRQTDIINNIEQQQVKNPNVRLTGEKEQKHAFPKFETQCFPIQRLILQDYQPDSVKTTKSQFDWVLSAVYSDGDFSLPHCIGTDGINVLLRRIQNALIDKGFITTRAVVEPQDLRSGVLRLTIIPGRISRLQLQDQSAIPFATSGTLWFAMPTKSGELLNVRELEQGLENLKRNVSSEANFELQATPNVGETDVIVQYKQHFPIHLTLGLDDSGTKATGRLQASATLSWENLTTLNDLFYASFTKSIRRHSDNADGDYGSKNISLYYSIPWKNYQLTLSGSKYDYHQTVAGAFEDYRYLGKSQQLKAQLSRLISRGRDYKTYASFGLWARRSSNYINDTEVEVQRRRMAGWEAGINHVQYIGNATLQLAVNYKRGTGADKSLAAPEELFGEGTSRPKIITASLDLALPFKLGNQPWRFNTSWNAQWNKSPLIQQDRFSIGGRYTVRGFDGELTLSAERGWVWRNDLAWNVANWGQEFYLGVDTGSIRTKFDELQLGRSLTGGVLGLRGNLWGLNYDYFVGVPIKKPDGFRTSHVVTGFNLSYRF